MLMFAITHRRRSASAHDQAYYVDAESAACAALHSEGVLRSVHRRLDGRGLVLLLEMVDREAARALLETLPTVEMGASGFRTLAVDQETDFKPPGERNPGRGVCT